MPSTFQPLLKRIRKRVRRVLAWEGVGRLLVGAVLLLWVGLTIDWLLEPPAWLRAAGVFAAVVTLIAWLARHTLSPLLTRLPDRVLAIWVEQRVPNLQHALVTSVEQNAPHLNENPLVAATARRAQATLAATGEPPIVDTRPMRRWLMGGMLGVASLALLAILTPGVASTYANRLVLGDAIYPRQNKLVVDGFVETEDGRLVRKVARGDNVDLIAWADLSEPYKSPQEVTVRYYGDDEVWRREAMARIGQPVEDASPRQAFRTQLEDVRSDVTLYLRGGDARLGPLSLEVSPRPVVLSAAARVTPPQYLMAKPREAPAAALGPMAEGSSLTLIIECNKPLATVQTLWTVGDEVAAPKVSLSQGAKTFVIEAKQIAVDGTLEIELTDTDGIISAQPYTVPIEVQADALPLVRVRLAGVGAAVTPSAKIVTELSLSDDYALAAAALNLSVDGEAQPAESVAGAAGKKDITAATAIDLLTRRFRGGNDSGRLAPGQQLTLWAHAKDAYDLADVDRTVDSARITLEVITPDQLLVRLEEREVNLRRTFEQTLLEMRRVERSIAALPTEATDDDETIELRMARLEVAAAKTQQETRAAAEAFAAIHAEMVNNRIEDQDLIDRVGAGIAEPLLALSTGDQARLRDALMLDALPGEAKKLAAAVTAEMQRLLDEMKTLENYNEVIALLRRIIDTQQRVTRDTEKARTEELQRLLLDP